jgi:hypothetical protein
MSKPKDKPYVAQKTPTSTSPIFQRLGHLHAELKDKYDIVDNIYLHPDVYKELTESERLAPAKEGDARGRLTVVTYVGPVDIWSDPNGDKLEEEHEQGN